MGCQKDDHDEVILPMMLLCWMVLSGFVDDNEGNVCAVTHMLELDVKACCHTSS